MSLLNKIPECLKGISIYPTGSKYICNPPVLNTDEDYLVLVEDFNSTYFSLESSEWEDCLPLDTEEGAANYRDEKEYGILWHSFRKDNLNIIFTADKNWYFACVAATELCKSWNILEKDKRIRIFRNLKYKEPLAEGDLPYATT